MLTNTAVFFILLKKALSHSPWVSGVSEQDMTTKSLSDTRTSSGTDRQEGEEEEEEIKENYENKYMEKKNTLFVLLLDSFTNH